MFHFCRRRGVPHVDAEDVVQKVMVNLASSLPQFIYDPQRGQFRQYLFRCLQNAIAEWAARPVRRWQPLHTVTAGSDECGRAVEDHAHVWEQEWVAHHYRLALSTVRQTFEPRSMEVFNRNLAGASVADLAREYGMSEQAIYKLRQRIRDRLEELIAEQVREEDDIDGTLRV
jgi:RNA polymerase sigma-70 factor (ECF subfamily)